MRMSVLFVRPRQRQINLEHRWRGGPATSRAGADSTGGNFYEIADVSKLLETIMLKEAVVLD